MPGPGREWKGHRDPEHLAREAQDAEEGEPWLLGGLGNYRQTPVLSQDRLKYSNTYTQNTHILQRLIYTREATGENTELPSAPQTSEG